LAALHTRAAFFFLRRGTLGGNEAVRLWPEPHIPSPAPNSAVADSGAQIQRAGSKRSSSRQGRGSGGVPESAAVDGDAGPACGRWPHSRAEGEPSVRQRRASGGDLDQPVAEQVPRLDWVPRASLAGVQRGDVALAATRARSIWKHKQEWAGRLFSRGHPPAVIRQPGRPSSGAGLFLRRSPQACVSPVAGRSWQDAAALPRPALRRPSSLPRRRPTGRVAPR
jgi:hypothetical protein